MIEWIIRRSVANRFLVLMGVLVSVASGGTWTIINTPVDALPDLSDCGRLLLKPAIPVRHHKSLKSGDYPRTTTMLSVPGAKTVRRF